MRPRGFALVVAALVSLAAPSPALYAQAAESRASVSPKTPQKTVEEITVTGTQQKIIQDFVQTYAAPTNTLHGQLARWNIPICPVTIGLSPAFNKFVTARVKEVAAQVGVKVETKSPCKPNLQIIVTPRPQILMDAVRKKAAWLLGSHFKAEEKDLATVRHPIQAWYATATVDNKGILTMDDIGGLNGEECAFTLPAAYSGGATTAPFEIYASTCAAVRGSRVNDGFRSEFSVVSVIVDINKIADIEIGPVADYVAMLALSQTKVSDACLSLPSITNLFAPGCDAARKANTLTAYDMAYLTGLYQMDIGLTAGLSKIDLANWMRIKLNDPNK